MKKNWMRGITGFLTLSMCLSLLTCGASAENGYSVEVSGDTKVTVGGSATVKVTGDEIGTIGSWTSGGTNAAEEGGDDYAYDPVAYVTKDGVQEKFSDSSRLEGGTITGTEATDVEINDSKSGHNGIIVNNTAYTIKNAKITMETKADGTDTCDFSGRGSAIMAVGSDAVVTVENSTITTSGVATMPIFADDGATVTIKGSTLISKGGTLYKSYMNSPDQTTMVAPPWILGIMGTSRCTNLMGNDSTMNVIDSTTKSSNWAVLSTDSGSNMYLNMYNTTLELTNKHESDISVQADGGEFGLTLDNPYTTRYGAGYGTYAIGDAVEVFAGATVNVGTYAVIFTGGTATFSSIEKGKTYTLKSATGENDVTYVATDTKGATVNSDTFGFMFHQSTNYLTLEEGTTINSGYATFLMKTGSSNETAIVNVDGTTINNGGVLIQVMDNDDATNGGMMDTDDAQNTNGGNMNFKPQHTENAGFATKANDADSSSQTFTFTNGKYSGNIYNASGTDRSTVTGALDASTLNVTFGEGATYSGAIASTAAIHVEYGGSRLVKAQGGYAYDTVEAAKDVLAQQNTSYDINEYYSQGQVANLILEDGAPINITLEDGATWTVTGTSVITSLKLGEGCSVTIQDGASLTIGGVTYEDASALTAGTTYGTVYVPSSSSTAGGNDAMGGEGGQGGQGGQGGAPDGMGGEGGQGGQNGQGGDNFALPETGGIGSGTTANSAYTYTWKSSDEKVAVVKNNGDGTASVYGISAGKATIDVVMYKNGVKMGEDEIVITASGSGNYSDVTDIENQWYYSAVYSASAAGLMNGLGENTFAPTANMTRAQAATVLVRLLGIDTSKYQGVSSFSDVATSNWAAKYIAAAKDAGIVNGYGDGTFNPNGNVSRQEFAKMIAVALKLTASKDAKNPFSDVSGWATEYVTAVYENGLVNGYEDGTFRPANSITRAEIATILSNYLLQ
jgi:RNase P/RNase MRP subunit p29